MITLKIKRNHPDAVLPTRAHDTDAGMDLTAIDDGVPSKDGQYLEYNTGISIELPPGYHALIHPRSSISKYDLSLANSVGLVDCDYRGILLCRFKVVPPVNLIRNQVGVQSFWVAQTTGVGQMSVGYPTWRPTIYKKGDRIAQLVIEKTELVEVIEEVGELSDSQRGAKGFGSSDKK